MERDQSGDLTFGARLSMAFRLVFNSGFARQVGLALEAQRAREPKAQAPLAKPVAAQTPPERMNASGLFVLSALQREGRLVDFLQQDVTGFSDEDIGAAARVVHAGCSKALKQYFAFEPAIGAAEGGDFTVPKGFDAQRIRLTGNVAGEPPFKGTVKHHGWVAKETRLPALAEGMDPRVIAPAEVELA